MSPGSSLDRAFEFPVLALTIGEPAGIGPDLGVWLAQAQTELKAIGRFALVLIGDPTVLQQRAAGLRLTFAPARWPPGHAVQSPAAADNPIFLLPITAAAPVTAGQLDPANAGHVLNTLRRAADGCVRGEFDALVSGPVHKGVINDAGVRFTGHTEFFAEYTGTPRVVMMLACPGLRVALVTTHLPLAQVSAHITRPHLDAILRLLHRELQIKFAIPRPAILVCGLNPHAGESGHMGREEIEIIEPVIAALKAQGLDLRGPVPADTAFIPAQLEGVDAVLAMYHDQGLPVLKHRDFAHAVNITLGLPFIRTAVDHGTALELAGSGRADPSSLLAAVAAAYSLARARAYV